MSVLLEHVPRSELKSLSVFRHCSYRYEHRPQKIIDDFLNPAVNAAEFIIGAGIFVTVLKEVIRKSLKSIGRKSEKSTRLKAHSAVNDKRKTTHF